MDRAKRREYQLRQRYRRIPISDADWKAWKLHAREHDATRTAFCAAVLRDFLANPREIALTARPRDWKHAQAKDRAERDRLTAEQHDVAEFVRKEREAHWLQAGAPLLRGQNVERKILQDE